MEIHFYPQLRNHVFSCRRQGEKWKSTSPLHRGIHFPMRNACNLHQCIHFPMRNACNLHRGIHFPTRFAWENECPGADYTRFAWENECPGADYTRFAWENECPGADYIHFAWPRGEVEIHFYSQLRNHVFSCRRQGEKWKFTSTPSSGIMYLAAGAKGRSGNSLLPPAPESCI